MNIAVSYPSSPGHTVTAQPTLYESAQTTYKGKNFKIKYAKQLYTNNALCEQV